MFKRAISVLAALAMMLTMCCSLSVAFADGDQDSTPSPELELVASSSVAFRNGYWSIDVKVKNIPEEGLCGLILDLDYDETAMELISEDNGALPGSGIPEDNDHQTLVYCYPANKKVAFLCDPVTTTEDAIVTLNFKIAENAAAETYTLGVSSSDSAFDGHDPATYAINSDSVEVIIPDCVWGDADANGTTNLLDVTRIMKYVVGLEKEISTYGGNATVLIKGDNKINLGDAIQLMLYLSNHYDPYADPFAEA